VFRSDRSLSGESSVRGGGVLLAVRNKFRAKQIDLSSVYGGVRRLAWFDVLVVECFTTVNSCVHFIVVYVPPKCSSDDFAFFCRYSGVTALCIRLQEGYHCRF
jgi:hypothetical protein